MLILHILSNEKKIEIQKRIDIIIIAIRSLRIQQ